MIGISQGVWNDSKIGSNLQSVDKSIGYSNVVGDNTDYTQVYVPDGFEYSRVKNGFYPYMLSNSCLSGKTNSCGIGIRLADRRNEVTLLGVTAVRKNIDALKNVFGRTDYENFPIYAKDLNEFINLSREKLVLANDRAKKEDVILAPVRAEVEKETISDNPISDTPIADGSSSDNTSSSSTNGATSDNTEKKNNSLLIYGGIGLGVLVVVVLLLRK
jgi:hypothetical protein